MALWQTKEGNFQYGRTGTGIAAIISGILLLFINHWIGFNTIMTTLAGGGIPILHIAAGVLMMWRDVGREGLTV